MLIGQFAIESLTPIGPEIHYHVIINQTFVA
jgi:hypothetical protein